MFLRHIRNWNRCMRVSEPRRGTGALAGPRVSWGQVTQALLCCPTTAFGTVRGTPGKGLRGGGGRNSDPAPWAAGCSQDLSSGGALPGRARTWRVGCWETAARGPSQGSSASRLEGSQADTCTFGVWDTEFSRVAPREGGGSSQGLLGPPGRVGLGAWLGGCRGGSRERSHHGREHPL